MSDTLTAADFLNLEIYETIKSRNGQKVNQFLITVEMESIKITIDRYRSQILASVLNRKIKGWRSQQVTCDFSPLF